MCGIVGYIGAEVAADVLVEGLKTLEYRGYDSAGVAVIGAEGLDRRRAEGKLKNLSKRLREAPLVGSLGIGHTRWATHGRPNETNAHPHRAGTVAVVHNGIIENYAELRSELQGQGAVFHSETDTEVVAHLVASLRARGMDLRAAVESAIQRLEGAYAIAVVDEEYPEEFVAARLASPLVLALGIGIANAVGKGRSSLSGFGIVTLASLFPILGVQLLGLYVQATVPVETILASAQAAAAAGSTAWHEQTPWVEIIGGVRAIVPLVLFLLVVLMVLLRSRVKDPMSIAYGISLCVIGMIVFNLGLTYGLAKLGAQAGSLVPAAFTNIDAAAGSPYYPKVVGLAIAIAFAWILGLGATLAEPALNALGQTVENLTNGTFPKSSLMNAVAWGVGAGIGVGVAKIIFSINLVYLLVPLYVLAMVLTFFSTEEFVNIAWDSAGVTTGPVTVPLVLAMGLGLGEAVNVIEGFGILSMASIGPILAVLSTGLWIKVRVALRDWRDAKEAS